jgi:hypothetical protein
LDKYEQYILYKYTYHFAEELNEGLRGNKNERTIKGEKILNEILSKLPDYNSEAPTFRGCYLDKSTLKLYEEAFEKDKIITETAFFSTSKSELVAKKEFAVNVMMTIRGKTGKDITLYAKNDREMEVLYMSNTQFEVIDFYSRNNIIYITLQAL